MPQEEAPPSVNSPAGGAEGGATVSVAVLVTPLQVAEMSAVDAVVTTLLVTGKVTVVPMTVALAGTVATEVSLLRSVMTVPPVGAAPSSVTLPVADEPLPTTLAGVSVSEIGTAAVTVRGAVRVTPFKVAETSNVVVFPTGWVVIANVPEIEPDVKITFSGTVAAAAFPLERETVRLEAAGAVSVTVPVAEAPPGTLCGFRLTDASAAGGSTVSVAFLETPL
jgi:hypothetical protein